VYVGDVFSKIVSVGSALILIRGLTVSDYAFFVAFHSIANLFAGLVGNGINRALVRFSAEYLSQTGRNPHSLYATASILEVAIFLLLMFVCLPFPSKAASLVLGQPAFVKPLQLGILYGLGLLLIQLGRSVYQAEERFTLYVGTLWLKQALTLTLIVGLWLSHALSFETVAWLTTALHIAIGIGIVFRGAGSANPVDLRRQDSELIHQFLSASGWLIAYCLTLAAFGQMDVLMLSRFASEEEVAVYGVALQYYWMALLLLGSIHAVLLPKFSRVEMQDPGRQRAFLARWLRHSIWIAVPIFLFDAVGKSLFVWINGVRYEPSFNILAILSVGVWLSMMFSPLINVLMSRKDFYFLACVGLLAFMVSLLGNYILVRIWGGIGAAVATVLSHLLVNGISFLRVYFGRWSPTDVLGQNR